MKSARIHAKYIDVIQPFETHDKRSSKILPGNRSAAYYFSCGRVRALQRKGRNHQEGA